MDYEHTFEELPIRIAGQPVGYVNGSASLAWDFDNQFVVLGIEIENMNGGIVLLNERSDDQEILKSFRDLSAELYADEHAQECFAFALAQYQHEAA